MCKWGEPLPVYCNMDKYISNVPVNISGESSVSCNMNVAVSNVPDNFSGFNDSEDTVVFQPLLASRMTTSDLNAHLNLIAHFKIGHHV